MKTYPEVYGELETIKKINKGFSIARWGDGEFGVSRGKGYTREPQNGALTSELRRVMGDVANEQCLIGIPTMDPKGTKYKNWERHILSYPPMIAEGRKYYSSLITRPDCGAWMLSREYAQRIQSIWLDKTVTFISSEKGRNKMAKAIEFTQKIDFIECLWEGAYSQIDDLEKAALDSGNELIILSHGVSATCLAARLSKHVQAVDLGSIGGFLTKMLCGDKWND